MTEPCKKKIKRSRLGCHRCKNLKIKCSEERPACSSCAKVGTDCDYSLKLTWGGRPYKNKEKRKTSQYTVDVTANNLTTGTLTFVASDYEAKETTPNSVKAEPTDGPRIKNEFQPLVENFARIEHGIESASHTLGRFSNRFSLRNSEIFTSYISSQVEPHAHGDQSPLLADLVDNYAADIARIENSFPEEPKSNYFTDFMHPTLWTRRSPEMEKAFVTTPTPSHSDPVNVGMPLQNSEEILALESLHSIPPLLTPLPELLLKVPYYRLLLHFWVNVACNDLVPAPSHMYQDNPFKVLLPQMGMHYPGVLTTILACAARARDNLEGGTNHQGIIDQLLSRSCNELLKQLQDKTESTSDGTLATILLLSCYEVVNSNDFEKHRTHTTGASQIISARNKGNVAASPFSDSSDSSTSSLAVATHVRDESDVAFFLMRWFVYVDMLGALASTRGRENYLRSYRKAGRYSPIESVATLDTDSGMTDPKRDIDYLWGFDVRLLPHFINLALLVREVEGYLASPGVDPSCVPLYIVTEALELKLRFSQAYEAGEERRQASIDKLIGSKAKSSSSPKSSKNIKDLIHHDNILSATNKMFFDMGMLNLYRRVLLLPRLSPLVQELVKEMAYVLEVGIESGSPAEVCTMFCHFCAGCETLDPVQRQFFFDRFNRLARVGNINATKSVVIMNRCWETGEDWITAANELDIDLVLI